MYGTRTLLLHVTRDPLGTQPTCNPQVRPSESTTPHIASISQSTRAIHRENGSGTVLMRPWSSFLKGFGSVEDCFAGEAVQHVPYWYPMVPRIICVVHNSRSITMNPCTLSWRTSMKPNVSCILCHSCYQRVHLRWRQFPTTHLTPKVCKDSS